MIGNTENFRAAPPPGWPQLQRLIEAALQLFHFPAQEAPELAKVRWLSRLRWMAVGLFFAMAIPGLAWGVLPRDEFPAYLGVLSLLFVFNVLTHVSLAIRKEDLSPWVVELHLAFDLLLLTVALGLSGGFSNPFVALFLLNMSLGGILIRGNGGWLFLGLGLFLLGLLQLQAFRAHGAGQPAYALFLISDLLLVSFWTVMRSLGAYLQRQQERQLQARTNFERQDRLRAIGALAAGFSHEFASPLNAAKLRLDRLARFAPSEDLAEALGAIRDCEAVIERMNSAQLDPRSFQFRELVIGDLLGDVVGTWREENPLVPVELEIGEDTLGRVPPVNFAQVLFNLLDNSRQAGARVIQVRFLAEAAQFSLDLRDDGKGIPAEVLGKLGEPFVSTRAGGTGLGLYVSQLFAQSLGGVLRLENAPGGGAVARLTWPRVAGGGA